MIKFIQILITLLIFLNSCYIGLSIARQKPLWIDEVLSERFDVRPLSYWDIITGKKGDDEKSPVYFCFQKFIEHIFCFQLPKNVTGQNLYIDKRAQLVCRINPIFWMSLSVAMIFYYFTRFTALWAGLSALLITLSTFMVWGYWAEDRIYAFWFFWTSAQSLVVLWASKETPKTSGVWWMLMLTNVFLGLTTPLSIVQIFAAAIWMFYAGYRKAMEYIVTAAIPLLVCFYYFSQAHHYSAYFINGYLAWRYITANIPLERIVFVLAAGFYLCRKIFKPILTQDQKADLSYLSYFGFMIMATAGILLVFLMKTGTTLKDFHFNGRHFIFLASCGIIALTFVFIRLIQLNRSWMIKIVLFLLLGVLTVPRIWKYLHFSYDTGEPKYSRTLLI